MRAALVLGLLVTLPCSAAAQTPASDFLALDPTGGFQTRAYSKVEEGETPDPLGTYKGWNVGVTIRPIRTFGVAGEIGRTSNGERSLSTTSSEDA